MELTLLSQLSGQCDSHIHYLEDGTGINKQMKVPWLNLVSAATDDGITIQIASGFRSFERQASIWNRKFLGELRVNNLQGKAVNMDVLSEYEKINAILLYSALPGASRHHWGTDIDIYSPALLPSSQQLQLEPWEYEASGYFYPLSLWLQKHAKAFGFYLPYATFKGGVAAEPWHLSYQPLAKNYLDSLTLARLEKSISESEILGKHTILENLSSIYSQYINNITGYS